MASYVESLRDQRRKEKLAREYSHPSSGYVPTKQEIDEAIAVGAGRKPQDIAYGEQGLQAPAVAGGLVSLDPTDYLSGAGLAKLAAMAKVGGLGIASLAGGMTAMNKLGAQSVPRMFGQAGMFAGRGAKTANLAMLAKAEEMAKAGIPDSQIWKETGWTLDTPDKLPRFEIPDNAAMYRGSKAAGSSYAEDVIRHPELYQQYPSAGGIRINEVGDNIGGNYSNAGREEITLGNRDASSTALHELQHAIQQREGFASGGSPDSLRQLVKIDNMMQGKPAPTDADVYDAYQRLAGEAEARLTQARMNLTPEERLAQYPYDPEYFQGATGVSLKDLIVRQK